VEETVDHELLRPAPGRGTPGGGQVCTDPGAADPARRMLLDRTFGHEEIAMIRHEVTALRELDVLGDRLHGYVLAINEMITNVVLHAGGHGRIVLERVAGSFRCTVTDSGPGIPEQYRRSAGVPEALELGGRGIWLAHQLCDEVTMATGPIGTTIGLRVYAPGCITTSELVNGSSTSN
jgi:anti-sigma regulatory factor (Ser/Thr protein kinase)